MKRRKEREFALQVLYAMEFNDDSPRELIERMSERHKKYATEFAREIINRCVQNKDKIDGYIVPYLKNWDYQRVAVIDKVLLRMAVTEFLYLSAVPPEVSMNEVLEISKQYSTKRSSRFINGVLDPILKKLRAESKIKKEGRGLISPQRK